MYLPEIGCEFRIVFQVPEFPDHVLYLNERVGKELLKRTVQVLTRQWRSCITVVL